MGLFFWRKNNDKIDAFARTAADELYSYVNPEEALRHFAGEVEKKKKKQRNIEKRVSAIITQVHNFSEDQSLGVYGKARLQQQFSERLLELGYDDATTKELVRTILLQRLA